MQRVLHRAFFFFLLLAASHAAQIWVAPDQDLYDIQLALQVIQSGDEVIVAPEVMTAHLTFPSTLNVSDIVIRGLSASQPISIGAVTFAAMYLRNVTFQYIRFDPTLCETRANTVISAAQNSLVSSVTFRECEFRPMDSASTFIDLSNMKDIISIRSSSCLIGQGAFVTSTSMVNPANLVLEHNVLIGYACQVIKALGQLELSGNTFSCETCFTTPWTLSSVDALIRDNVWNSDVAFSISSRQVRMINNTFASLPSLLALQQVDFVLLHLNRFSIRSYSNLTPDRRYFGIFDARFNFFGQAAGPTQSAISSLVLPEYFPWCLAADCSKLAFDCPSDCPAGHCAYETGLCDNRMRGSTLFPIIVVPTFAILILSFLALRRRLITRNSNIYLALQLRYRDRRPLLPASSLSDSAITSEIAASSSSSVQVPETDSDEESRVDPENTSEMCVVCLSEKRRHICVPCGHLCLCSDCATLLQNSKKCPLCRQAIQHIQRVFK